MRSFAIIFLLFLVGVAAWLIWDKLTRRTPHEAPRKEEVLEISDTSSAPEAKTPERRHEKAQENAAPASQPNSQHSSNKPELSSYVTLSRALAKGPSCLYVQHTHYGLCYDEEHEQPRWTVYILSGEKLNEGRIRRTQDFRPDPKIPTRSAQLSDYKKSGYDRGHLVPAGDFKWDSIGMSETFYLSNMSPQLHEFNAGIWEEVESTVRAWARQKKVLVVYTGPILDKVRNRIGTSKVSVPPAFYKVVYHIDEKKPAAVGFIVPHAPSQKSPMSFLVSVDSVERVTGIDFFYELPDEVEEQVERRFERSQWEVKQRR
ncbi:MAG: DNA/RNA non-specific endonuclease [Bacteroidia bacterium]|nr:DNA/RNA non-specific endonuclease [Bacteroidia bacterium]